MRGERYVVLGLAHARSDWFREVARWATSAALPVEFEQTVSLEQLRALLRSGRAFSAVLLDGGLPGLDRDLLDAARRAGCAVFVVGGPTVGHDWPALGANTVLAPDFDRTALLDALDTYSVRVGRGDDVAVIPTTTPNGWRAPVVAVTGSPGAGSSTVAMALAQGLAADPRHGGTVLLADLHLDADQAALHDARDVVPGVAELVDAHRSGEPTADEIRSMTFRVPSRAYHLLLGLRRHRDWTVLRPRAFEASLDGLRRSYSLVVADVDHDLEGEADCGSVDVEERNLMARTAIRIADVVVAVGGPGLKGTLGLVRVQHSLLEHGVPRARLVTVVNRAPRGPKARAEMSRALAELVSHAEPAGSTASPVFLPERRQVEQAIRDVASLPAALVAPVTATVAAVLARRAVAAVAEPPEPVRVAPGSLGSWAGHDELTR